MRAWRSPEIVRDYGQYKWFDPGDPASEDAFIAVLTDVVKRYDVDGVHIDDYFYPYKEKDKAGKIIPFPDDETYMRAVDRGSKLSRDDWRRQNVDHLVERMYREVKALKPWVLVGISPFGIWRPENPPGIKGFDAYSEIYCDSLKWEHEGWFDYLTPQLYWLVESEHQSYPKLLSWWAEQNVMKRHLWPGNFTSRVGDKSRKSGGKAQQAWTADDIIRQIEVTRATPGASGNVQFSMKALMKNFGGIDDKLKNGVYANPALVPETPWLGHESPARPQISARRTDGGVAVHMKMPRGKEPSQWLVQLRTDTGWKTAIVPGQMSEKVFTMKDGADAKAAVVSAISRLGQEGPAAKTNVGKEAKQ